ncbi:MAG: hypothetical protein FWC20_03435 [Oscillospiraceae bacterium]|nr:hypothetical protein [Oscillospiraceae bacterium]
MILFKYELYKVITKKVFWGILGAALAVNMLALWWLNPPPEGLSHAQVREVYDTIRPMNMEDKITFLSELIDQSEEHEFQDEAVWLESYAYSQLATAILYELTVNTHTAYLDRIDEAVNRLLGTAIFGSDPNTFPARNISRTQRDFYGQRETQIRFDVNEGLFVLLESPSTDIIIVLLMLTICTALITDEKDRRLFLLIKATPNGQTHTITAKLGAMAVCIVGVSTLTFLSGIIFAEVTFGLGDVTRSVQSVPLFIGSTLRMSVAEFLGLNFLAKTAGMLCIGAAVMLIAIYAKHSVILMAATAAIALLSVLMGTIPIVSTWNILRFLNMFTLLRPHRVFGDYFNLNIFGYPVNTVPVFVLFGSTLLIGLVLAVCISFIKKRGLESDAEFISKITSRITFRRAKNLKASESSNDENFEPVSVPKNVRSWKYFELKKLAFTNKALLFLTALIIIQGFAIYAQAQPRLGFQHHSARNMLRTLHGPLTDEKEAFILSEKARYDRFRAELNRLSETMYDDEGNIDMLIYQDMWYYESQINSMQGFLAVYERYRHILLNPQAEFLYDSGYVRLFGMRGAYAGLESGILLIIVLILSLGGLFSMEYKTGMYKVLGSTLHGHTDTVKMKLFLSSIFTIASFIFTSLPELIYIGRFFGYPGLGFSLSSILPTNIGGFPAFMSGLPIWTYLVFMLLMRLSVFMGVAVIILAISMKTRNTAYAVLLSSGILVLPLLLHLFGFEFLNALSLLNLITVNPLIVTPSVIGAIQITIFALISIMCRRYIFKNFGRY